MSKRDFNDFLKNLALNELKDNTLLKVINRYWGTDEIDKDSKRKVDDLIQLVKNYIESPEKREQDLETDSDATHQVKSEYPKDFRISSIKLSSLRGIGEKENDIPYGVDLMDNSETPLNAVIVGHNGSGKTSIFSALEYMYTGEISEAKLRSPGKEFGEVNYEDYLNRTQNHSSKTFCEVTVFPGERKFKLGESDSELNKIKEYTHPQASFISEFDIYDYGKESFSGEEDTLHNRITMLFGFKDYVDLNSFLRSIKSIAKGRRKEKNNLDKARQRILEIKEEKNNIKKNLSELKMSKSSNETHIISTEEKLLETLKRKVDDRLDKINLDGLLESLGRFSSLQAQLMKSQSGLVDSEKVYFLESGIKLLEKERTCPFCGDSKIPVAKIKENVRSLLDSYKNVLSLDNEVTEVCLEVFENLKDIFTVIENYKLTIEGDLSELSSERQLGNLLDSEKEILWLDLFTELESIKTEIELFKSKNPKDPKFRSELIRFVDDLRERFLLEKAIQSANELSNSRVLELNKILKQELSYAPTIPSSDGGLDLASQLEEFNKRLTDLDKQMKKMGVDEELFLNDYNAFQKIKGDVDPIIRLVESEINSILGETITPLKETLQKALDRFLEKDKLGINIEMKDISSKLGEPGERLCIELFQKGEDGQNVNNINPKEFFNAFRYKVFCGTISIGVALAARKNSGINLPLILDDEFFASDITNRAEFEEYFKQIILAFRDITPEMPLQFILFTHDELVFESAREAVLGIDEESYRKNGKPLDEYWKCPLINNTKFARLFPYSQKEKTHKTMRDGSKYWNLLFEFGNNVKEQEVNES